MIIHGGISGIQKPQNRVEKQKNTAIPFRNLPKYRNSSYKCARCRVKYFRLIITLELPHLFSQCFPRLFSWKFVKMLIFKLKYSEHELRTLILKVAINRINTTKPLRLIKPRYRKLRYQFRQNRITANPYAPHNLLR